VVGGAPDFLKGRGDRLLLSTEEHPCVLASARHAEVRGWKTPHIGVAAGGIIRLDELKDALREKTALVSLMLANNETGVIQPVREASRLAGEAGALFHTDATQAPGRIRIDVKELGVDYLSLSAHKFYGPKGVGILFARRGVPLEPFMRGGEQEHGRRAGTLNGPGITGMGEAASLASRNLDKWADHARAVRNGLENGILSGIRGAELNGAKEPRLPSHLNVFLPGVDAEALLMALDVAGVSASTGSACSSGTVEPSHVLAGMGFPRERALSSIRLSTGEANVPSDADAALEILVTAVNRLLKTSPRAR